MTSAERLGVLGVGRMGLPVCARLVTAGFSVTAFDIRPQVRAAVEAAGAIWAPDVATLAASVDIVITVLPGAPELEQAMSGANGGLRGMAAGSCWLDLTSNDPRVAHKLAALANADSIVSVSAPMGGGVTAATSGTLTFFVGGAASAIDRVRPVFAALGAPDAVRVVGEDVGAAHTAKLLANLLWFGHVAATTEALLLGQSLGIDLQTLRAALGESAGGSTFMDRHLDHLLAGDYLQSFGLDRCVDELEIVTSLAAEKGVPFELSSLVTRLHEEALARFGPVNGELLVAKLLEERAGRQLRACG
ncbi:MAG TPA: NAD(P)-dependent oxidoreductase [Microbacteriaceae bacterium]